MVHLHSLTVNDFFFFLHWSFTLCASLFLHLSFYMSTFSSLPSSAVHFPQGAVRSEEQVRNRERLRCRWEKITSKKSPGLKTRDERVERRTKTESFTYNVLQKAQHRSSFFCWNKKSCCFFFRLTKHTQKNLLAFVLDPFFLSRDFPFKNQSFTKHRKMQHWTQHKKTGELIRSIFFTLFSCTGVSQKLGKMGMARQYWESWTAM